MSRRGPFARMVLAAPLAALVALVAPLAAQVPDVPPAPPPGGLVPRDRPFALALGFGRLSWDGEAPYEDHSLVSLSLERGVMRGVRGRASLGYGETTLLLEDPADTRILSIDLHVVVLPDVGPLRGIGVAPYALGGVGSLVVNPVGEEGRELPTRAQTQVSWGGGVQARIGSRWDARLEGVRGRVRLADPVSAENGDTTGIHVLRWEGKIQWVF